MSWPAAPATRIAEWPAPGPVPSLEVTSATCSGVDLRRVRTDAEGCRIVVGEPVDGELEAGALTVLVAVHLAADALVTLGREEGVPQGLATDIGRAVVALHGGLLDRRQEHEIVGASQSDQPMPIFIQFVGFATVGRSPPRTRNRTALASPSSVSCHIGNTDAITSTVVPLQ